MKGISEAMFVCEPADLQAERERIAWAGGERTAPSEAEDPMWWNRRARRMLRPPEEMKLKLDELLETFAAGAGWDNVYGELIRDETWAVHKAVLELVQGGYPSGRLGGLGQRLCSRAAPRLPRLCSHCHWQPLRPRAPATAAFTVMCLSRLPPQTLCPWTRCTSNAPPSRGSGRHTWPCGARRSGRATTITWLPFCRAPTTARGPPR
jgi:hypothetical protein